MQSLQEVWSRLQETKKQQKNIHQMYKDSLENLQEYKTVVEKIKELGARKKQLEAEAKHELGGEYEKLAALKKDMQLDKELLADIAISNLMKGQPVTLVDSEQNEYEPMYSVRFKKVTEVRREA